jgi:hypothetical protein
MMPRVGGRQASPHFSPDSSWTLSSGMFLRLIMIHELKTSDIEDMELA